MFEVDFKILNQKATPAIYADTLALRPSAGFEGRLFVATDSPYGVFRDTGTSWVQIASNGGGGGGSTGVNGLNGTTNIGLGGTLTNNTSILGGNFDLTIQTLTNCIIGVDTLNTDIANIAMYSQSNNPQLRLLASGIGSTTSIWVEKDKFYSTFNTDQFGLLLDDTTGKFALGDYGNNRKYNSIVVNDDTDRFYFTTTYNQTNIDQDLLYASNNTGANERFIKLGDFNGYQNDMSFVIDDANSQIYTTASLGITGIYITNDVFLGYANNTEYTGIRVEPSSGNYLITTRSFGNLINGLSINFNTEVYSLGGFSGNGNTIEIDDGNNNIKLTTQELNFVGAALESASSGLINGKYLVINLNGNQYKIALQDPN